METRLFEEAKKSKVLLNGFGAVVIMLLMMILGQLIGVFLMSFLSMVIYGINKGGLRLYEFISTTEGQLYSFIFPLLACLLWVQKVEKRKVKTLGLERKGVISRFLKGFGIGFILFALVSLLMLVFKVARVEEGLKLGIRSWKSILFIIPAWIIQSSTEEVLSRGWLMHVVGARHRPMTGFLVSSLIFGALHIFNPGVSILSILNIVLVGFMFGFYVIYTEELWGACGIHAAWNFAQGNIFGFKVSGMDVSNKTLLKLSSRGPDILTGGAFGPEASIFASLVVLGFTLILLFKIKEKKARIDI